jgi:hypothetical protein
VVFQGDPSFGSLHLVSRLRMSGMSPADNFCRMQVHERCLQTADEFRRRCRRHKLSNGQLLRTKMDAQENPKAEPSHGMAMKDTLQVRKSRSKRDSSSCSPCATPRRGGGPGSELAPGRISRPLSCAAGTTSS